jgi:uncharacterized membrane protein YhaH (DUF805 family)
MVITSFASRFGRISRTVWAGRLLCTAICCCAFGLLLQGLLGEFAVAIVSFSFLWCACSLSAQRLHDTGKSSWNLLWLVVPVVGPIVVLCYLMRRGTKEENRFGRQPDRRGDYLRVDIAG